MSYLYKIGFYTLAESDCTVLYHDDQFTRDDIQAMVIESILEILPKKRQVHNFQDICNDVIGWLKRKKGFREVDYETEWSCEGLSSMFVENRDTYRDGSLGQIITALNAAGYSSQ